VDGSIAGALAKPQYIDAQYSAHGGVVLMVDGDLHLSVSLAPCGRLTEAAASLSFGPRSLLGCCMLRLLC
jgi:hypothetical protein